MPDIPRQFLKCGFNTHSSTLYDKLITTLTQKQGDKMCWGEMCKMCNEQRLPDCGLCVR